MLTSHGYLLIAVRAGKSFCSCLSSKAAGVSNLTTSVGTLTPSQIIQTLNHTRNQVLQSVLHPPSFWIEQLSHHTQLCVVSSNLFNARSKEVESGRPSLRIFGLIRLVTMWRVSAQLFQYRSSSLIFFQNKEFLLTADYIYRA